MNPSKDLISKLQKLKSKQGVRDSVQERYEYEKQELEKQKEKEDIPLQDQENEIDWDDFAIVDTIYLDDTDEVKPEFIPEVTFEMIGIEDNHTQADQMQQEAQQILQDSLLEPGMKLVKDYKKQD